MTAFNVVRFKVKPGREQAFLDFHNQPRVIKGMREGALIKTGERSYCLIAKWDSQEAIIAARPQMISMLDQFRNDLEDLGPGLGVTDAVSGAVSVDLPLQ
jgi:Antibiotic biosynthesis monooxygenase